MEFSLQRIAESINLRQSQMLRAAIALAAATMAPAALALLIDLANSILAPERAVTALAAVFMVILVLPSGAYIVALRRSADAATLGVLLLATVAALLVSIYLFWVSFYVRFPADILIWSEGDFVNDILKFRVGYPIYSPQVNSESFTYTPGSQLLTYLLAWISGNPNSIPTYRAIQVLYSSLAAVAAFLCCRRLVAIALPGQLPINGLLWGAFCVPVLFLIATNSLTNPFTHALHNDALAQLVFVISYWCLLEYVSSRNRWLLAGMALLPALGFLVKQSLAIWAPLYIAQLVLFDRPRSLRRVIVFMLLSAGALIAVVGVCYLLWQYDFVYWVFVVLGSHSVSPLRAIQHMLSIWPYLAIGLVGGALLLRGRAVPLLLGPWMIWLAVTSTEVWSSGIAWMLNHIGPGSLVAGAWFLAGSVILIPLVARHSVGTAQWLAWFRVGVGVAVISLLFSGLGVVRIPVQPVPTQALGYVNAIEREFQGQDAASILLDFGTWVYVPENVIMKDRGPSIGERGYSETGDFSGLLDRIRHRTYSKILLRSFHDPDFTYDHYLWQRSSGIREALLANYREVGTIPGVPTDHPGWMASPQFAEISILLPR